MLPSYSRMYEKKLSARQKLGLKLEVPDGNGFQSFSPDSSSRSRHSSLSPPSRNPPSPTYSMGLSGHGGDTSPAVRELLLRETYRYRAKASKSPTQQVAVSPKQMQALTNEVSHQKSLASVADTKLRLFDLELTAACSNAAHYQVCGTSKSITVYIHSW